MSGATASAKGEGLPAPPVGCKGEEGATLGAQAGAWGARQPEAWAGGAAVERLGGRGLEREGASVGPFREGVAGQGVSAAPRPSLFRAAEGGPASQAQAEACAASVKQSSCDYSYGVSTSLEK